MKRVKDGRSGGAKQGLGQTGERLAAECLEQRGYRIIEHNYRCPYGEIDLIAEEGQDLVFIEVKTRRGTSYGLPEEAVNRRKQQKLVCSACHYLSLQPSSDRSWRIDVVAVQLSSVGKLEEIRVHPHALQQGNMNSW